MIPVNLLFTGVFFAVAALSVDVGWRLLIATQLQVALDAAALAGAKGLEEGPDEARDYAIAVAAANPLVEASLTLTDDDIELGSWDADTNTFTVADPAAEAAATAVRINVTATGIAPIFGMFAGGEDVDAERMSIAIRGGSEACGIIGDDRLQVEDSAQIDSWNSAAGTYAETSGQAARLCGNDSIELNNNVIVGGDIHEGPTEDASIAGSATLTGEIFEVDEDWDLPDVDSSAAMTTNDNGTIDSSFIDGTDLVIGEDETLVLAAGTYWFDDIEIEDGGRIEVTGQVHFHLFDDIKGYGSSDEWFINADGDPRDFIIYHDTTAFARIEGQGELNVVMLSPYSNYEIEGGVELFGVVVARDLEIEENSFIHVDTSIDPFDPTGTSGGGGGGDTKPDVLRY